MYQTIYSDEEGHSYFYDKKNKKLAELNLNVSSTNQNKPKNYFVIVPVIVTIISNSIIGSLSYTENFNLVFYVCLTYVLVLVSSIIIFIAIKNHQSKMLEQHQIPFSEELLAEILAKNQSYKPKFLKFSVYLFLFSAICFFCLVFTKVLFFIFIIWFSSLLAFLMLMVIFIPYVRF